MRQIILDTETTGLETKEGHRIIEIGCVELINRQLTGNSYHQHINPQREVETEALAIHGITNDFLQDKPTFALVLDEFLNFIDGTELIAHNASFDVGFINHEIQLLNTNAKLLDNYITVLDTLPLARKMFPGQRNSLDALCKRYKIDLSTRKISGHGALLDAQLLANVYLAMTGGQTSLFSSSELNPNNRDSKVTTHKKAKIGSSLPIINANTEELSQHQSLLTTIKKSNGKCLWEES